MAKITFIFIVVLKSALSWGADDPPPFSTNSGPGPSCAQSFQTFGKELPSKLLSRWMLLSSWRNARNKGEVVPLEAQPISYFRKITPRIFLDRDPQKTDGAKYAVVRREKTYSTAAQMTQLEIEAIFDYIGNPNVYQLWNPQVERNLRARFAFNLNVMTGRSWPLFDIEQNLRKAIELLEIYDRINHTAYVERAVQVLLRHIDELSRPKKEYFLGNKVVEAAFYAANSQARPSVLVTFLETVSHLQNPELFISLKDAPTYIVKAIDNLQGYITRNKFDSQAISAIYDLAQKICLHRVWMAGMTRHYYEYSAEDMLSQSHDLAFQMAVWMAEIHDFKRANEMTNFYEFIHIARSTLLALPVVFEFEKPKLAQKRQRILDKLAWVISKEIGWTYLPEHTLKDDERF